MSPCAQDPEGSPLEVEMAAPKKDKNIELGEEERVGNDLRLLLS